MNTKPESLPQTSSILKGEKIHMHGLDTDHRKVSNTPKNRFQDQNTNLINVSKQDNNQIYLDN